MGVGVAPDPVRKTYLFFSLFLSAHFQGAPQTRSKRQCKNAHVNPFRGVQEIAGKEMD
jgi:hypothetical protein